MITMGLRAAPKVVTFAIYDSEASRIVNVEAINIPSAFARPDALKYVRNNILDVMREYDVVHAGVRTSEPIAKSLSVERVQIEGVIQEAFASSSLKRYFFGPMAVGAAVLGIDRGSFKPITKDGRNDFEVDGWDKMSEPKREAVLYAMGAINA
tara:strand:+ start:374 stop:832 length:459 start_codon:yes stop_codon:yes gene_type:complete